MRERLFIRLPSTAEQRFQSLILDGAGQIVSQLDHDSLASIADAATNRRVTVFVPTADVVLLRVQLPTRNKQKMLKAIPYAVEDQLADDVEQLHFALGKTDDNGTAVATTTHGQMHRWMEALTNAGIEADELTPDVLSLPYSPGEWTLSVEPDMAMIRTGEQSEIDCETSNLALALELALGEAKENPPTRLRILNFTGKELNLTLSTEAEISEEMQGERSLLQVLAENFSDSNSISLLQGVFSRQQKNLKLLLPWIPAAAALAGWLILHCAQTIMVYNALDREVAQLTQAQIDIYKRTFPEAKKIPKPMDMMKAKIKELRGGGAAGGKGGPSLLALMNAIGPTLHNTSGLAISTLNYRGDSVVIDLTLANLEAVDQLKSQLATVPGVVVEVQRVQAQGDKVQGILKIQGA